MNHGRTGDRHYNSGLFQRVIFPISIAFLNFIAALAIIIVVAKAGGYVSTRLGQPSVPEHISEYLAQLPNHVCTLTELLSGIRNLIYIGRGPAMAMVGTAALISKEAAHFMAEGMSSASFRHGPLELVTPELYVLRVEGGGKAAVLNNILPNDIRAAGGRVGLISQTAELDVFSLPVVSPMARPLL